MIEKIYLINRSFCKIDVVHEKSEKKKMYTKIARKI